MVALVEEMAAVDVFGGRVCSIVVCRMVLTGPDVETEETVCGLVGVMCIPEVVDPEEVESDGSDVTEAVCGADGVGNVVVACSDVVTWGAVLCVVLETNAVGGESVVCGVRALLCVGEVVWTTEVPVTPVVGFSELVVARIDVD